MLLAKIVGLFLIVAVSCLTVYGAILLMYQGKLRIGAGIGVIVIILAIAFITGRPLAININDQLEEISVSDRIVKHFSTVYTITIKSNKTNGTNEVYENVYCIKLLSKPDWVAFTDQEGVQHIITYSPEEETVIMTESK